MKYRPSLAVILAAGRGVRFGPAGQHQPKGFIVLAAQPIIERSIQLLQAHSVSDIIIVTGHCRAHYERLAQAYPHLIKLVHNPAYATSGSLLSLHTARALIGGRPYLLLESDLVYETAALPTVLNHPAENVLLASGPTASGDEVYISASHGRLSGLTKIRAALKTEPFGEFVGITKIGPAFAAQLSRFAALRLTQTLHVEYEEALVATARDVAMVCHLVPDLVWSEIDNAQHLTRAQTMILPRLRAADTATPTDPNV